MNKARRIRTKALLLSLLLLVLTMTGMPAKAASYPLLFAEDYTLNASAGEIVTLKYRYYPEYKNEKIEIFVYDQDGAKVASATRTFYHSGVWGINYSVTWNTDQVKPGKYTAVAHMYFYSFMSWHEAPTTTDITIDIACNHSWDSGTVTRKATTYSEGRRTYKCTKCGETRTESIPKIQNKSTPSQVTSKKANPIKVALQKKTPQVKYATLKKKNLTVKKAKVFKVTRAQGKVTFKKLSGSKCLTISKGGVVKIKKGTKKGVYKAKIAITAAGNSKYKKKVLYKTIKVAVR